MESITDKSAAFRVCRFLFAAGERILVLSLILGGTGCLIFPVPSMTPDYANGIFDDARLDSLIGLEQDEAMRQIGWPDYSGPRGHSDVMVYQGEKRYSTDVYLVVAAQYGAGGGKVGGGASTVLYCQVLELDENKRVESYDVIARPTGGIGNRDEADNRLDPVADCSEVVWEPGERKQVLTKTVFLETRAEQGDTEAAIELVELTGELAPLRQIAARGDAAAAVSLARKHGEWAPLESLAARGDETAISEMAAISRQIEEARSAGDVEAATRLAHLGKPDLLKFLAVEGNYQAAHTLADEFDDDTYLAKLGEEGDYIVAYERYQRPRDEPGSSRFFAALRLLCAAANAGYAHAHAQVGNWHRTVSWENWKEWNEDGLEVLRKAGFQPDDRIAYSWYSLAASNGNSSARKDREFYFAKLLTDADKAQAEQIAHDWKPGDCPSAEHRLGPPG